MDSVPLFLTEDEVAILTGRKIKKLQVEALRKMGVPFFVNAANRPTGQSLRAMLSKVGLATAGDRKSSHGYPL